MIGVVVTWQFGVRPDPGASHLCPRCGSSDHGRPVLADGTFISVSHAGDVHAVATTDAGPVGIDIEAIDGARFEGFDDVVLHPRERPHTSDERATTWVRKEALLKATGDGLAVDPRTIRLSDPDAAPKLLEWVGGPAPATVWMSDLDIADGYRAAVTVICEEAQAVTVRRAMP